MRVLAKASLGAKIADVVRVEFFDLERDRTSDLLQEESSLGVLIGDGNQEISEFLVSCRCVCRIPPRPDFVYVLGKRCRALKEWLGTEQPSHDRGTCPMLRNTVDQNRVFVLFCFALFSFVLFYLFVDLFVFFLRKENCISR